MIGSSSFPLENADCTGNSPDTFWIHERGGLVRLAQWYVVSSICVDEMFLWGHQNLNVGEELPCKIQEGGNKEKKVIT